MENVIVPWNHVFQDFMNDGYREVVIREGLTHLLKTSSDLSRVARKLMSPYVQVDGFRSFYKAPIHKVFPVVEQCIDIVPDVAAAIICIWADKQSDLFDKVHEAALTKNIPLAPWEGSANRDGFRYFEDTDPLEPAVAALLASDEIINEDGAKLASLILSHNLLFQQSDEAMPKIADQEAEILTVIPETDGGTMDTQGSMTLPATTDQNPTEEKNQAIEMPPSIFEGDLESLSASIERYALNTERLEQSVITNSKSLLAAVKENDLVRAVNQNQEIFETLQLWDQELVSYQELTKKAFPFLQEELAMRPDLPLNQLEGPWRDTTEKHDSSYDLEMPSIVDEIIDYDKDSQRQYEKLQAIQGQIATIQEEISNWQSTEEIPVALFDIDDETMRTRQEIITAYQMAQTELVNLKAQQKQLRDISVNNIQNSLLQLEEMGIPQESIVIADPKLNQGIAIPLAERSDKELADLENQLSELVEQSVLELKSTQTIDLAQSQLSDWEEENLVDLLSALAKEKRDVESILLLLSANAAHPRGQNIELEPGVVYSLLRGIGQLSPKATPFELLDLISSLFLSGWKTTDHKALAESCLVFTAAHCCSNYQSPGGILWSLSSEWPVEQMPHWNQLWQALLLDEQPILVADNASTEQLTRDALDQAKHKAKQAFLQKDGRFIRVNNIKSRHHKELLGNHIFPQLYQYLTQLIERGELLEQADPHKLPALVNQLQNWVQDRLEPQLSEENIIEKYDEEANQLGIIEKDGFHRRASIKITRSCAEDILDFGQCLFTYWDTRLQNIDEISQEVLAEELTFLQPATPLGQFAPNQLFQVRSLDPQERDVMQAEQQALQIITQELCTRPSYSVSMPRLVTYLTKNPLEWLRVLRYLLEDIANPLDPAQAASWLLENKAPFHTLLLTQYIDVDLQKDAQKQQRELTLQISTLETELLKIDEHTDILPAKQEWEELGRYQKVIKELQESLSLEQDVQTEKIAAVRQQALELRENINNLDSAIFAVSTIPGDVRETIDKGFAQARQVLQQSPPPISAVEDYIDTIRYRLEHDSWPPLEIYEATEKFIRALDTNQPRPTPPQKAENVLSFLQRGELRHLGLDPDHVPNSLLETRKQLLQAWLDLKKLPGFLSNKLTAQERANIHSFLRIFARMSRLNQSKNPQGKPLVFEDPTIYAYMKLVYPKTEALKRQCILVTLPGNPPNPKELALLESLIEDKEWLEPDSDYAFVFLFIPDCTEGVKTRLERLFVNRGLVIIDEPALLSMCLAMESSQNAVGRLRPLMLNSLDARTISIFQVNQACHPRTSIFVGRTAQVSRFAESNSNFAVYGGRRIGKTSILRSIKDRLDRNNVQTVLYSFEGADCSDVGSVKNLGRVLDLKGPINQVDDFRFAVQQKLDNDNDLKIVLMLDEIDRYITFNRDRHLLIETLRALSDYNSGRFRVVIAGFIEFFDCLRGRGPYTKTSDPWQRMLNDDGSLGNLKPENAEAIVTEGFINILGWKFENPMIPQRIVVRTGGHPSFVQHFCGKLQDLISKRGDRVVRMDDIDAVFADEDPDHSFIAHVRTTLDLNLEPLEQWLVVWLAVQDYEAQSFTREQMKKIIEQSGILVPPVHFERALQRLDVTSVVKPLSRNLYQFSVPDYPNILDRLGETHHLDILQEKLERYLAEQQLEEM